MNRIDYNQAGGFPLSTQILDAAQKAYTDFNQLGYLAGNNLVIITGCEPAAGGTVTNGFVVINGELLPFVGTTQTANVIIVETPDARGFEDGSVKPVIYTRYATFGDGETVFVWEDFRRPMTLFALEDRLTQLEKAVPVGLVAIWDRPADEIPLGWVEHTDLAGRTPVGHQTGDVNFGALGGNLGAAQVSLTAGQLPKLQGTINTILPNSGGGNGIITITGGSPATIAGSTSSFSHKDVKISFGNDESHSNIQPSRIVKFIRFVGFN